MNIFPAFSNIDGAIINKINSRFENLINTSGLNAWVSVASAKSPGLELHSNRGGGFASHYGSQTTAGITGQTWNGGDVGGGAEGYKPSPYVSAMEIEENIASISRKASFTIVAHTQQQCNELIDHFLEPGYSVFLQWGWNTNNSKSQLLEPGSGLSGKTVANFSDFNNTTNARKKSEGEYDNYLGFITGGGVSRVGDKWEISVKLTGHTELPGFLNAADTATSDDDVKETGAKYFPQSQIKNETDLGKKRFMMMFNELPSNRRTNTIANLLLRDSYMLDVKNYINFDMSVIEELSNKTAGSWVSQALTFLGIEIDTTANVDGKDVDIVAGTKLVHEEKFIRFGALIKIFNLLGGDGYTLANGKTIQFAIDTNDVPISAFKRIFSLDRSKLFIPNANTPNFSISEALEKTTPQSDFKKDKDNTINYSGQKIQFPRPTKLLYNNTLTREVGEWGYLNDLYVNFDFAKSIIETKNFSVKDAMYQLLNGISAAAGAQWDFQLQESTNDGNSKLRVEDFNLVSTGNKPTVAAVFNISGTQSPFIDNSLDLDIGGAKMNQIIGERLKAKLNSSSGTSESGNIGTDGEDMVMTQIKLNRKTDEEGGGNDSGTQTNTEEEDDLKKKNFELFMERVGIYPKVELTKDNIDSSVSIDELVYIGALNDLEVLESQKLTAEEITDTTGVGSLTNIKFSFTIHGVSGIKRGDKFRINGLPSQYTNKGFFQVVDVKHTIDGMLWKTEVTGGWRPFRA
jgi:chemotaxis protein CheY-P-specific phosphatase CheC